MSNEARSSTSRFFGSGVGLALLVLVAAGCATDTEEEPQGTPHEGDWSYISGTASGQRYSPLDQINAENFADLEVAWTWDGSEFSEI